MITKGQKVSDRYLILRALGEGGMANVYLAHDTILDRDVAIKILRGDLANDEKFVRRFQREALSASALSHHNIVEMYDVGEDNGTYYIVMEYVEGKTVKQLIKRRGALTLSESIDIMVQLADGISQAHDSYIIHRDLKPQNILIKEDGGIKITDFGIAMALNSTQLTQTNSVMGSVHYLPPEQASGKNCTIRSDIYSMGIFFYEMLTGELPFKGENAVEIALKQLKDPIPSVRSKNSDIPQSIENIIIKATAKNPKNRYRDVKEMKEDLLTALNPDRANEKKYIFPYPEHEEIEKKASKDIKTAKEKQPVKKETPKTKEKPPIEELTEEDLEETEEIATLVEEDSVVKNTNVIIWILLILILFVGGGVLSAFVIYPMVTEVPDVIVPDVTGKTVAEAEKILKEAGLIVNVQTIKIQSDLAKGLVIETDPAKDREVKKGNSVTIYESLGKKVLVVESYIGLDAVERSTFIETEYGIDVEIIPKQGEAGKYYEDEDEIIGQSAQVGEKLSEGDKLILYTPIVYDGYPDMVNDGWTLEAVQDFCKINNLNLFVDEEANNQFPEGTIIHQSRPPKTPIVQGVDFRITITKLKEVTPDPGTEEDKEDEESKKEETDKDKESSTDKDSKE